MRIAVYHNQPSGGARRALHGFLRELSSSHTIVIYTLTSADNEMLHDEDIGPAVNRIPFAMPKPRRGGLYLNDLRRRQGFRELREVNRLIATMIDAGRYDVVLADACRYVGAPYVLDYLRTPTVYFCHHRIYPLDQLPSAPSASRYSWIRDRVHAPFARHLRRTLWRDDARLMSRAGRVLVNSEYSRQRIAGVYGIQATVCRYGVDLPPIRPRPTGRHVLSVGTLEAHKGHDLVVEAIAFLPENQRPPLLIVANDGNRRVRADLVKLASARGVDLRIKELPPQVELDAAYEQALLLAFGAHDEPLGLVVLEAMARSVPVVAVGEAGVLETVIDRETGFLAPRDPRAMSDRIQALLLDAGLRARMGAAGRLVAERRWAWDERAAGLESVLADLAASSLTGGVQEIA